jgi:hypothetical protein
MRNEWVKRRIGEGENRRRGERDPCSSVKSVVKKGSKVKHFRLSKKYPLI